MNDIPLRPDELPNPQVRAHARQIADAAIFLYENMVAVNCVPSVLLESTLAIELYLKSLNAKTQHHPMEVIGVHLLTAHYAGGRKHTLTEIYDEIDEPIRDELQRAYAESPVIRGAATLRNALACYDNLFVEIRYIFERQHSDRHNITGVVNLLQLLAGLIDGMEVRFRVPLS